MTSSHFTPKKKYDRMALNYANLASERSSMPMCNICNLGSNKSSSIPCFKCKSLIHRKCLSMSNDTWNWFKSSECNFVCKVCSLPPKPSTQNRASCKSDGESLSRPEPSTPVLITNHDQEESDSGVNTSAWTQIVRQEFAREQQRKQIVITVVWMIARK